MSVDLQRGNAAVLTLVPGTSPTCDASGTWSRGAQAVGRPRGCYVPVARMVAKPRKAAPAAASMPLRARREAMTPCRIGVIQARIHGRQRILTVRRDELNACFPGLFEVVLGTPEELIGTKRSD